MKLENPFKRLSKFEKILYISSVTITLICYFLNNSSGFLSLIASLIGATALIFLSKGDVIGQFLSFAFAMLYGYISLKCHYYGEMITYVFMTAPMAVFSIITWLKNPYKRNEVRVRKRLTSKNIIIMLLLTALVTFVFYFILKAFNTANLILSTISIATSFMACFFAMLRSPLFALAYALNDIVLISLWILVCVKDMSYLPMVICFVVFLANDLYGYFNWSKMSKAQD